jgi:hypothetical protein
MWPDLSIGIITLIDAELDVHDIGFKPSLIWPPQLLHYCSVGYQPCMHNRIDVAEKALLQANHEHKQEHGMNAI